MVRLSLAGNLIAAITYVPIYMAMKAYSNPVNAPMLTLLVLIQVIYVTMVYGPIAAYLVEAYPAKIRYSAFSLPYHIGNGVFGGLVPLVNAQSFIDAVRAAKQQSVVPVPPQEPQAAGASA